MQEKPNNNVWFLIIYQCIFTHTDFSCNHNLTASCHQYMSAIGQQRTVSTNKNGDPKAAAIYHNSNFLLLLIS